jgi:hypothetical protein
MATSLLGLIDESQDIPDDVKALLEDDAPKRKGRPPGSKNKPKDGSAPSGKASKGNLSGKALENKLAETFTLIGMGVAMRNKYDGQTIIAGAGELSAALVEQAASVPWLMRTLQMLASGASSARLVSAVCAVAIPIGVNHGKLPPSVLALVPGAPSMPVTLTVVADPPADVLPHGVYSDAQSFS